MSLVSRVDEAYANSSEFYADALSGLHVLLLAAGWTLFDELVATPGSEDRVYHSDGEVANEALFVRVTHDMISERLYFRAYGLWDAVNHVGFFEVGDVIGSTAIQLGTTMQGWMAVDKDGFTLVAKVGTDYHKFFYRRLERTDPYGVRGRTTLAAQKPGYNQAGDGNLFLVSGTSFLEFGPGFIWVVNQRIDSGVNAELVEILSVDAGARAFVLRNVLVNSYDFGALVALNPIPAVMVGDLTGVLESSAPLSMYSPSGFGSSAITMHAPINAMISAADDYSYLPSGPLFFASDIIGSRNLKGSTGTALVVVPVNSVNDEDTVQLGGSGYVVFKEPTTAYAIRVS